MLTLVEDRVVIRPMEEPGADLSMAVPLLATTYGEVREGVREGEREGGREEVEYIRGSVMKATDKRSIILSVFHAHLK